MATEMKHVLGKKRTQKAILKKLKMKLFEKDLGVADMELLKTKFKNLQDEFDTIFHFIFDLVNIEENPEKFEKFSNGQDDINNSLTNIKFAINERLSKTVKRNEFGKTTVIANSSAVRLLKISLPTFTGEIHFCLYFKDIFKASIDQNPNLSEAIKLQYLKSVLKGDAFRIIQTISITNSNYQLSWSLLEYRYSNTREQVYAPRKRMVSIPAVQNESSSAILNLIDVTSEVARSLESVNKN